MANDDGKLLNTLKSVGQFVGVVGGGGAGFAGLAFGIGYLALKHHDAMMGMPTTTTDNSSYVRTGALFFTQSLHDVVDAVAASGPRALWVIGIGAVVSGLLWLFDVPGRVARWKPDWVGQVPVSKVRFAFLLVASVVLLLVSVRSLPSHLAPLDIGNQNLLFEQRGVSGVAKVVNDLLRSEQGEQALHRLYGRQLGIVLALALGAFLLYRWRWSRKTETQESGVEAEAGRSTLLLVVLDWVVHPALFAVIAALLVSMPANYGVLAMSTSLPCVHLYAAPRSSGELTPMGDPGFLVSDLSSEATTIGILRWDIERRSYFVDLHPRSEMKQIEVRGCTVTNPVNRVPGADRGPRPPK
jgi:hypothetical protein